MKFRNLSGYTTDSNSKIMHWGNTVSGKWLIAELHAWAKLYSWKKLVVSPSDKFLIVTWPNVRFVHPSVRPHHTGKQFIISHFLAGVWSLKTNIAQPCRAPTSSPGLFPQKLGGAPPIFWGKSPGDEVGRAHPGWVGFLKLSADKRIL